VNLGNLFEELKRRKVFRVGAAYLVVGWIALQVVGEVADPLKLPDWTVPLVVVLLGIGFPVAIVLAWAFEVTPEGVKKTPDTQSRSYLFAALAAVLLASGGYYYYKDAGKDAGTVVEVAPDVPAETLSTPALPAANDKSIAVLPFVDMSSAGDQEYLGDGITEEILNVLVHSRDLRVVGRTSSFAFKGTNQDLRAIGEALGVAYILEGSIRKAGERVRVTAQLVKASDGFHLWSQTYDRTLNDIFALQDEIAAAISGALETSLDYGSTDIIASRTSNTQANEMYLQGLAALKARGTGVAYAVISLTAATELDPEYASAWSSLGFAYNQLWNNQYLGTDTFNDYRDTLVKRLVEKALVLNPDDTTAHHLKANLLRANNEWAEAALEYALAIESDPQSAAIYEDYAEFLSDAGRLEDAVEAGLQSYKLDPLTPLYITAYAEALFDIGDYAATRRFYNLTLQQNDQTVSSHYNLLSIKLMEGRYDEALLQANEPNSRLYDFREFLTTLIDYAKGKATSIPEVSANPESIEEYVKRFYAAIVLMNLHEVDAIIKISGNRRSFWMKKFFSQLWERDEFHQYVIQAGLVDYWRQSGTWGDMCRPLGEDDFECGVFE
jgi:TolB-like protein/Tfp pilus assembly protein PilF